MVKVSPDDFKMHCQRDDFAYATKTPLALTLVSVEFTRDPGRLAERRTAEVFSETLAENLRQDPTSFGDSIAQAARASVEEIAAQDDRGLGSLCFSAIAWNEPDWQVASLGANLVFLVRQADLCLVVEPHSLMPPRGTDHTSPASEILADASSWAVSPEVDYEPEIRFSTVNLGAGEWLVATPSSSIFPTLKLRTQPHSLASLKRQVLDQFSKDYAARSKAWIGVQSFP